MLAFLPPDVISFGMWLWIVVLLLFTTMNCKRVWALSVGNTKQICIILRKAQCSVSYLLDVLHKAHADKPMCFHERFNGIEVLLATNYYLMAYCQYGNLIPTLPTRRGGWRPLRLITNIKWLQICHLGKELRNI